MTRAIEQAAFAVYVTDRVDRTRRRVYLSLRAAENAARRATEQGRDVDVILVRLEPVATIDAEEAA